MTLLLVVAVGVSIALVVSVNTMAARAGDVMSGERQLPVAPTSTGAPAPTSSPGSTPARTESLPPVRRAAELTPDQLRLLDTEVAVTASDLRYFVMDGFGKPIYHCVFSVALENLTDSGIDVGVAFRTVGAPGAEWSGTPSEVTPGKPAEMVLGWDGLSPEEVGVTEAECAGAVELTSLTVAGG